jgi:hypothetical protein
MSKVPLFVVKRTLEKAGAWLQVYGELLASKATDQYTWKNRSSEQVVVGGGREPPLVSTEQPDSVAVIIMAVNPSNNPVRDFVVMFVVLRAPPTFYGLVDGACIQLIRFRKRLRSFAADTSTCCSFRGRHCQIGARFRMSKRRGL